MSNSQEKIFRDRQEAGQKLAEVLLPYKQTHPIILGLPRGGVVLAYEIAKALSAPLDVIVARKIGAPGQPEYAIGAIAPNDIEVLNPEAIPYLDINKDELANLIRLEKIELLRRIKLYRGGRAELDLKDRVVIVVDDGLATGQSAIAAIRSIRKLCPKKIILAVGVGAIDSVERLKEEADQVVCIATPEPFYAVGIWYEDFKQTSDAEVIELLQKNRAELK